MSSAPSRSSADPFAAAHDEAARTIVAAITAEQASNPVILIDGRSGSGKTTLTHTLVAQWPLRGRVQMVALDQLYPGWDGLDAGAAIARDEILIPHARGMIGVWQRWDWQTQGPAEAHAVDPSLPLIVEGCGLLTPRTARLSDIRIWLDSPAPARKRRALDRDGDVFRAHWDRWALQEDVHIARDRPQELATHVFRLP